MTEEGEGFCNIPFPTVDNFLYRPVAEGMWKQHEATDGTYTFEDLLIAHEILDIQNLNKQRYQEWTRQK